tara:strand:- start:639 stop:1280 length:642 start_codon:yes stop_codon:yes gene_type:complete
MARHYFRNIPNIGYKNVLSSSVDRENYVYAKNLFLRAKVRDVLAKNITFLKSYIIKEGVRPDMVADQIYGDPEYDWIILTVANIINVRSEWPMSSKVLYDYCDNKYGLELNDTQYYETTEVKDNQGRLILPAGKIVDKDFTIPHPDTHNITLNPVIGINNYLVETRENEKKRNIKIMRKEYLTMFLQDMKETLEYTKSSQYASRNLKKAYNPT